MKTVLTLLVLGICCIIFDAPLVATLGIMGTGCCVGAYELTKSGAIDRRYKFNYLLFLVGLGLIIAGLFVA